MATPTDTLAPRSALNEGVPAARPGEFAPLRIGPLTVDPPVVLAPMAGVTNVPFRTLCREFGAGLYVSEMITARGLLEGAERTWFLAAFAPHESPRSIQLYGTDPAVLGEAVRRLVGEGHVDHVDMNFGCPAAKVTRKGGGAALPVKRKLFGRIVEAAVGAAGPVPVTVKFRKGLDDRLTTFLDAGRIAEAEGAAAVALHARTAEQLYSGAADWDAIGELKATVTSVPVLGNGDIWEPWDALRMMRHTGCDGVVVGRGCLGRPWLFRDLAAVFAGAEPPPPPRLGEVADIMRRHAHALVEWTGERGIRDFRKHGGWYVTGFPVGPAVRRALNTVRSLEELDEILAGLDPDARFPAEALRVPRSHSNGPRRVALPDRWLEDPDDPAPAMGPDDLVSGG